MKKIYIAVAVALLLVLVAGCNAGKTADASIKQGQSLAGGSGQLGEGINLKDVDVQMQGVNTLINMSFISGSRPAGVDESMISSAPEYKVSVLGAPSRLKVELNVDFLDYQARSFTDSLISGMFRDIKSDGSVAVYFQLNDAVSASVQEKDAVLSITLEPLGEAEKTAYFAVLDAYAEYDAGLIPDELGLTPTLGESLTDVTLISAPYQSMQEAQPAADKINSAVGGVVGEAAYTIEMSTAGLPPVEKKQTDGEVNEKPVFEMDDEPNTLPVLIENGKYLCTAANGDIIYSRPFLKSGEENENVQKEELWLLKEDGSESKMELPEFYGVEMAAISTGGRYLGLLEGGLTDKVLYVYDFTSGELMNLGEEGFGDNTSSFVWDGAQDIIYAMTGYGKWQLLKYDFSKPEAERVSSVEEKNGNESKIALANGKLYFADESEGASGSIYSVDIASAQRERIADGIEFAISPDGRYLVSCTMVAADEQSNTFNLDLIDLTGGGEAQPVAQSLPEGTCYAFGTQPGVLYYSTQTYESAAEEYPFAFISYDTATGESKFLGYSKTGTFVPGDGAGELLIIDYSEEDSHNFPVTYVYNEG